MTLKKSILTFLISSGLINLLFFTNGYFFNYKPKLVPPLELIIVMAVVVAALPYATLKIDALKKFILSFVSLILFALMTIAAVFLPMYLPGSREHNYVMYKICLPAMSNYYKENFYKMNDYDFFKEHLTCEQNVWQGREPLEGIAKE